MQWHIQIYNRFTIQSAGEWILKIDKQLAMLDFCWQCTLCIPVAVIAFHIHLANSVSMQLYHVCTNFQYLNTIYCWCHSYLLSGRFSGGYLAEWARCRLASSAAAADVAGIVCLLSAGAAAAVVCIGSVWVPAALVGAGSMLTLAASRTDHHSNHHWHPRSFQATASLFIYTTY